MRPSFSRVRDGLRLAPAVTVGAWPALSENSRNVVVSAAVLHGLTWPWGSQQMMVELALECGSDYTARPAGNRRLWRLVGRRRYGAFREEVRPTAEPSAFLECFLNVTSFDSH